MNKRSKSQIVLRLKEQNQTLRSKIQQSKPVLETIYDKVKRKQKVLYDKIASDRKCINNYKDVASDFRKLYEESIEIMKKAKLVNKFQEEPTNFLRTKYKVPAGHDGKSKSVYQQYRERITRGLSTLQEQKNPQIEVLRKSNQQVQAQMLEDIDRLRLVREKSQKALRKATSVAQAIKVKVNKKPRLTEQQQKKLLITKRRQRLAQI